AGQTPTQTLDVEYAGGLDWRVTELDAHKAPYTAHFKELYRQPGQVGYRVTITLKPDAPPGNQRHELYLKTNDPASPHVPILVEAMVQASLSVFPPAVKFGNPK